MTPSGARGVVNNSIAVYFADATIASAFVARWCVGHKAEVALVYYASATVSRRHAKSPLTTARLSEREVVRLKGGLSFREAARAPE